MPSIQTLSEADRRLVAAWAADCAERALVVFEAVAPHDMRPRRAIERARAFARGELSVAGEIRRRFADAMHDEIVRQLRQLTPAARTALARLPRVGEDPAGPLGPGLLSSGKLGDAIRTLQSDLAREPPTS